MAESPTSGITLFAGRGCVVLDAPRSSATVWTRWIWFGMVAPLLTIAALMGSMLPRRA
jgi:hypothetical protein